MKRTQVLGAVLAGGRSSRFGSPKGTAMFLGEMLALRVARIAAVAVEEVVVVTQLPELEAGLPFPTIADRTPGAGPLGGLHAALEHGQQSGMEGVLLLGCDMPLVPSELVRLVVEEGCRSGRRVAAPAVGPVGVHPLCAWYDIECLPQVERALEGPDRSLLGLIQSMGVHEIPYRRLREVCGPPLPLDPAIALSSVNTPAALRHAERLLLEAARDRLRPAVRGVAYGGSIP